MDQITIQGMPEDIQQKGVLEINKLAGLDTFQFGDYGIGDLGTGSPCKIVNPDVEHESSRLSDDVTQHTTRSQWGTLTTLFTQNHPAKYPVESIEDLQIYKDILINSTCEEILDDTYESKCQRVLLIIGEDGIYCPAITCSPVQDLLQHRMGVETFNYLLADHPQEVEELLGIMNKLKLQEMQIMCRRSPFRCMMPVENTSTAMISPTQYKQYSVPQMRAYADIIHKHGKIAIWHMCGHLSNLLPIFKETNLDGINSMTPPPIGNTDFDAALDILGEDFIILGGLMSHTLFHRPNVTRKELWHELDRIYTPRIRAANFLLQVPSGAIPIPLKRFHMIRDWFEANR